MTTAIRSDRTDDRLVHYPDGAWFVGWEGDTPRLAPLRLHAVADSAVGFRGNLSGPYATQEEAEAVIERHRP